MPFGEVQDFLTGQTVHVQLIVPSAPPHPSCAVPTQLWLGWLSGVQRFNVPLSSTRLCRRARCWFAWDGVWHAGWRMACTGVHHARQRALGGLDAARTRLRTCYKQQAKRTTWPCNQPAMQPTVPATNWPCNDPSTQPPVHATS
eukprot:135260-Chlamydomonas_euryale.AAC.1